MQNILKSVNKTFYMTELLIHYKKIKIKYNLLTLPKMIFSEVGLGAL